jgi:hypothetical protein
MAFDLETLPLNPEAGQERQLPKKFDNILNTLHHDPQGRGNQPFFPRRLL